MRRKSLEESQINANILINGIHLGSSIYKENVDVAMSGGKVGRQASIARRKLN